MEIKIKPKWFKLSKIFPVVPEPFTLFQLSSLNSITDGQIMSGKFCPVNSNSPRSGPSFELLFYSFSSILSNSAWWCILLFSLFSSVLKTPGFFFQLCSVNSSFPQSAQSYKKPVLFFQLCPVVNTNLKYKEDDFTESIAVNFSQDMCIHTIHFRHEAHTCSPRSFVLRLTLYTPSPQSG